MSRRHRSCLSWQNVTKKHLYSVSLQLLVAYLCVLCVRGALVTEIYQWGGEFDLWKTEFGRKSLTSAFSCCPSPWIDSDSGANLQVSSWLQVQCNTHRVWKIPDSMRNFASTVWAVSVARFYFEEWYEVPPMSFSSSSIWVDSITGPWSRSQQAHQPPTTQKQQLNLHLGAQEIYSN